MKQIILAVLILIGGKAFTQDTPVEPTLKSTGGTLSAGELNWITSEVKEKTDTTDVYTKTRANLIFATPSQISDSLNDYKRDTVSLDAIIDDYFEGDNFLKKVNAFIGADTIKALPLLFTGNTTATLSDGRLYLTLFRIEDTTTMTGIKIFLSTQGNYTPDNFNGAAIFSNASDSIRRVAISENYTADPNVWEANINTLINIPFTAPVTLVPGYYWFGTLYNNSANTTNPVMRASSDFTLFNLVSAKKIAYYVSSQSTIAAAYAVSALSSWDTAITQAGY